MITLGGDFMDDPALKLGATVKPLEDFDKRPGADDSVEDESVEVADIDANRLGTGTENDDHGPKPLHTADDLTEDATQD